MERLKWSNGALGFKSFHIFVALKMRKACQKLLKNLEQKRESFDKGCVKSWLEVFKFSRQLTISNYHISQK